MSPAGESEDFRELRKADAVLTESIIGLTSAVAKNTQKLEDHERWEEQKHRDFQQTIDLIRREVDAKVKAVEADMERKDVRARWIIGIGATVVLSFIGYMFAYGPMWPTWPEISMLIDQKIEGAR